MKIELQDTEGERYEVEWRAIGIKYNEEIRNIK